MCTLLDRWYGARIEAFIIALLMGNDSHALLSKYSIRILAYAIDNVILVSTQMAMERLPHHYFKFLALQALAKRREIMILLNSSAINLRGMLWSDVEDLIVLNIVFAILISYGLAWRARS